MRQVTYRDRQFVEAQHPNQRLRRHFVPQKEVSNEKIQQIRFMGIVIGNVFQQLKSGIAKSSRFTYAN
jgi:hypothetical protein